MQLGRAIRIFSGWTAVSRLLGFAREMGAANCFGASGSYDAFVVAFRIPNLLRRIFAEGALTQAFVPILAIERAKDDPKALRDFIAQISGVLCIALSVCTVLAWIYAEQLVQLCAPGLDLARITLATAWLQIMFGYLLCVSWTALMSAVLNLYGQFSWMAISPIVLNCCMLGAMAWGYQAGWVTERSLTLLAVSVGVAGVCQVLFQAIGLWRIGLWAWPTLRLRHPGLMRVWRFWVPAVFAASVLQLNSVVSAVWASHLPVGSISCLYYAERLLELPLGVFGVALSTVVLPTFSHCYAHQSWGVLRQTLDWALRWIGVLGIPAMVGLWVLAPAVVCAVFQYGAFGVADTAQTTASLRVFACGIVPFIAVKVLLSVCYAGQRLRLPLAAALLTVAVNAVGCTLWVGPFQIQGLAMASVCAAWVNLIGLGGCLMRDPMHRPSVGCLTVYGMALLAAIGMGCGLQAVLQYAWEPPLAVAWAAWGRVHRISVVLCGIGLGTALYGGLLLLCGLRSPALTRERVLR